MEEDRDPVVPPPLEEGEEVENNDNPPIQQDDNNNVNNNNHGEEDEVGNEDRAYLERRRAQLREYREQANALQAVLNAEENFLGTVHSLNHQNRRLERKINEADAQNNLLQMQLQLLKKKMENLEGFMQTFNYMEPEVSTSSCTGFSCCPKCGYRKDNNNSDGETKKDDNTTNNNIKRSDSFDRELFGDWLPDYVEVEKKSPNNLLDKDPMMIELIVSNIMGYLEPPDLLRCRQVCRVWSQEASPHLRRKFTFTLKMKNVKNLTSFVESPDTSYSIFGRLRIQLDFAINPFRAQMEEFFELYGPNMISLAVECEEEFPNRVYTEELRSLFFSNLQKIEELEFSLPTKITEKHSIYEDPRPSCRFVFPFLKVLKLNQTDSSAGGYGVWLTKELIRLAPNLETLQVFTRNKEVLTRILLAFGDRECKSIAKGVRGLMLDALVSEQHLGMLLEMEFDNLEVLQLSTFTVEVSSENVEAFLGKHRKTLKSLTLGDYQKRAGGFGGPLTVRLPILEKLRTLKFVDPCFPDHRNILLSPLSYSVQLPVLRELEFQHEPGKPSGPHLFTDVISPCMTLKTLKIFQGLTDPTLVSQAASMFPSLRRLELANMNDSVLREVWTHFDFIEELILSLCPGNVNVDSLFTGIPFEVCKKIQERNMYGQVETLDVLEVIRTDPALTNLTKLKTLRIDGLPSTLITAVTGYLALSQMKSLTSVSIKEDVATLSRECKRILGERLNLTLFELF